MGRQSSAAWSVVGGRAVGRSRRACGALCLGVVWLSALTGCLKPKDPAPGLTPPDFERARKIITRVEDANLQRTLMAKLDKVLTDWPTRRADDTPVGPIGEPVALIDFRNAVREVPDARIRGELDLYVDRLGDMWADGTTDNGRPLGWYLQPEAVRVDSFTSFKNDDLGTPYLEARVQVLDRDGHPMRAPGRMRLEMFEFARAQADPRGRRLALWHVDLQDRESNRRYYDQLINGYTFALDLEDSAAVVSGAGDVAGGNKFVVEATFIRADGRRVYPSNYRYVAALGIDADNPDRKPTAEERRAATGGNRLRQAGGLVPQ